MEMKFNKKHLVAKVLFALGLGMYAAMPSAYALPSMGTLDNSRAATVTVDGKQMTIEGKGANNVINWASFGIDKGETVKFNDKNNYLNMVYGVDISRIYGTISGGNIIYLVNPNGILFAEGTRLDNVGSFVASTRNISSINKEEFLKNPGNVEGVLGKDNTIMDNKDYYPEYSKYVPKISVADIQLTNVPASATQIILDGPGGVVLKNTELLNKATTVMTRKDSGEIGIGSKDNQIHLTEEQQKKIVLIDEDKKYQFSENPNVLSAYATISTLAELPAAVKGGKFILTNDILAPEEAYQNLIVASAFGKFDGIGYSIKNLKMNVKGGALGLFGYFNGDIRNVNLDNIDFSGAEQCDSSINWPYRDYVYYPTGGIAGQFKGVMSNVFVSGNISVTGGKYVGGLVGYFVDDSEIRNSSNLANVRGGAGSVIGGIVGGLDDDPFTLKNSHILLANVCNQGNLYMEKPLTGSAMGGIIGGIGISETNKKKSKVYVEILGAQNYGNIDYTTWGSQLNREIHIGGILGGIGVKYDIPYDVNLQIGESYNFGKLNSSKRYVDTLGDIIGLISPDKVQPALKYSNFGKRALYSYYINGVNENKQIKEQSESFGQGITSEEMNRIFNKDIIGFYIYPKPGGNSSGASGGSTGGNTGGSTGGNTGGSTGGNTGGSTGGNPGEVIKPDGDHAWKKKGYQKEIVNVTQDYIDELIRKNNERQQEPPSGKITHEDSQQKNINYEEWLKNSVYEAVRNMQTSNEKNHEKLLNNKTAANESFRKLKDLITVTPSLTLDKRSEFTNDAYQAFFDFLSESIANKEATKLTKDDLKKVQKTAGKIKKWISQNQATKTVNGVEYTFESTMFNAQGTSTGVVEMSWKEKNGKTHRFNVSYTDVFTDEGKEALVDYAHTMTEVGREATAKAAGEVVSAITGSRVVGKVTNRATEALMDALSNDKKASDFAKACGKDVENYVKGAPKEKLKQLISDNVAGGKEVVNAIENLLSIQK